MPPPITEKVRAYEKQGSEEALDESVVMPAAVYESHTKNYYMLGEEESLDESVLKPDAILGTISYNDLDRDEVFSYGDKSRKSRRSAARDASPEK